jgi:hypothetical protein
VIELEADVGFNKEHRLKEESGNRANDSLKPPSKHIKPQKNRKLRKTITTEAISKMNELFA